eukprot:COSAG06_NODE_1458_length_9400_cov_237.814717_3_plen_479_part_00
MMCPAGTGEMGTVVRQHQCRVDNRQGGERALYRCIRKGIVRAAPDMASSSRGDIVPGDIMEELYTIDVEGTRRLSFETVWATRGPNLGLNGWTSVVSSAGATILEEVGKEEKELWLLGTKPTLLRRAVAMYKSLAEQSMVHSAGSGGGVYTCVKAGVIRKGQERQSEKVGQLDPGAVVPVSFAATLDSGVERVRFESTSRRPVSSLSRSPPLTNQGVVIKSSFVIRLLIRVGVRAVLCGCAGVWKSTGPNLGLAGWSSIAAANGGIVLEPLSEADAQSWREGSLKLLAATLGRQGLNVELEARNMSTEELELLLDADGVTLSRVAQDTYAQARKRWRKGLSKLAMIRALSGDKAPGGTAAGVAAAAAAEGQEPQASEELRQETHLGVLEALRRGAQGAAAAATDAAAAAAPGPGSSLIRTDLKGPATVGAMAAAVAECATAAGQTSSTADMLRKLAASLAQLDAASKAAASEGVGDEV